MRNKHPTVRLSIIIIVLSWELEVPTNKGNGVIKVVFFTSYGIWPEAFQRMLEIIISVFHICIVLIDMLCKHNARFNSVILALTNCNRFAWTNRPMRNWGNSLMKAECDTKCNGLMIINSELVTFDLYIHYGPNVALCSYYIMCLLLKRKDLLSK